ncbi:hypothetical protein BGZ60DRAFT_432861 [Tricladium varicosporioides]|nr:hypothetical protein BGZ60DRAFT_432861 [Hymenoscyphus varicosporioides]
MVSLTLLTPAGTIGIYTFAISMLNKTSTTSIRYTSGTAVFGKDFVGPSPNYILPDRSFSEPLMVVNTRDNAAIPKEISIEMSLPIIDEPVSKRVGPEGSGAQVVITAWDSADRKKEFPTRLMVMYEGQHAVTAIKT